MQRERELDNKIARIQRSTRTLAPIFVPIHDRLRLRYRWYYLWHLNPWAKVVHYTALAYVVLLTVFILTASFVARPNVSYASASEVRHDSVIGGSNGAFTICGDQSVLNQYTTSGYRLTYSQDSPAYGTVYSITGGITYEGPCPLGGVVTINTSPQLQASSGTVYLCDGVPDSPNSSQPCGTAPDTTPPVQSNIQATNISQTGATISWTTDESATHTIKYDTTSGSYDSYANTKAAGSSTTSASGDL